MTIPVLVLVPLTETPFLGTPVPGVQSRLVRGETWSLDFPCLGKLELLPCLTLQVYKMGLMLNSCFRRILSTHRPKMEEFEQRHSLNTDNSYT